jgi:class 3 adenylate cyclase/predicted ATPase
LEHEKREPQSLLSQVCAACGFANPTEFRFCGGCGSSLERQEPERRQLTVLFCDLVGSSKLASRLDPEEMRDLMLTYQSACTAVIRRFDGTVSRYVGDGILALFGYPRAHEDNAERAVRAGLEIISAMATLPVTAGGGGPLAVRIGIATGLVVVGDLIGEAAAERQAVVGETPNLAARLQGLASSNSVVISAGTRALIGERFHCVDLGSHALHGFTDSVRACRVLAERQAASRFEAAQPVRLSPLINREEPLSLLRRLWEDAEKGTGRVALLVGEAGIGKSRVVEALLEHIVGTPYSALRYQCSPHYVNTALYPVIQHTERAAGIGREDTPAVKRAKLSAWVGAVPEAGEAVPLLAALLSIPSDERFPLPAMSPQRQKERTFELLLGFIQRLAAAWPVPIVFEDVHWVDPTTQEFLTMLVQRVREMRALVILTSRPEFSPPWRDQPHVELLELSKLAPEHATGLAQQVAGVRLPKMIIEEVVAKTDGVPLFIEELTRAVLGTGLLVEKHGQHTLTRPLPLLAIPSTLQDSLMARLDQMGPAKIIAQVAGAIGREFSYELLEAIVPLPPQRLREGLEALQRAGLVYAESRVSGSIYTFKHALVQEVAYQSLLRSRRRELHSSIAEVLERSFPQTARDTPELVAHHWTEAGNFERAIAGWLAAGRRASERSEYREAIGHLRTGMALIPNVTDAEVRWERELALLLALGPALITTEGGGTPEVRTLYQRALDLCAGKPESAPHFAAYWGWWRASMDLRAGSEWADKMLGLARTLAEPALLLQAHHCQWATHYMRGAHGACCHHIDRGLELYDPSRDHPYAALYAGHDVRVCALGERALARWLLGHPQEALEHVQAALAWAKELKHVGSRAHAMDYALVLHKFRRSADVVAARADELMAFASEQQLRDHRAKAALFRGWARSMRHDVRGGLNEMLEGMAAFQAVGTPEDVSLYYEMLAEAFGEAGRYQEGLRAVEDAFAQTARCGILFWNAELHRRRGELLLASGAPTTAAAACFREALACARAQNATSLELRAALSLARLHRNEGEVPIAATILRPILERFQQTDTPDAAEARELLETLV